MHGLSKARKVVAATMKLRVSKLLFNQPVDPEALGIPNYLDVVKQPMDLGTIYSKLSAGEQQNCEYKTAGEVYCDVSKVWDNCVLYNSREVDKPAREAALEVKAFFDQKWKEAGLDECQGADSQATNSVPESSLTQSVGIPQGNKRNFLRPERRYQFAMHCFPVRLTRSAIAQQQSSWRG